MDLVNSLLNTSENELNNLFDNKYLSGVLKIFLISYACIISPKLPQSILQLLDNTIVKLLIIFAIVYIARRDFTIALLISIAFVITLQIINKNKLTDLLNIKNVLSGGNVENPTEQPVLENPTGQPVLENPTGQPVLENPTEQPMENVNLDPNVSEQHLNNASNSGILTNVLLANDNELLANENYSTMISEPTVSETMESETMMPETMESETMMPEIMVPETMESETMMPDTMESETMMPENMDMSSELNTNLSNLLETAQPVDILNNDTSNTIFESVQPLDTQQPTEIPTEIPISNLEDSDLNIFNKEAQNKNKIGCFPNTPNEGLLMSSIAANSAHF